MAGKIFTEQHFIDTIAGHEMAKSYLVSAVESDHLPHALLFHGPAGVGKLSMAYALTKRLNCLHDAPAGCKCNICRKIAEGKFADILVVEPRGATGSITLNGWRPGKDDPDNLQYWRFIETRPLEGSRKVLVLRHAERMNVALANYILKLMEEPPSFLNLILISNRKSDLLPTIRSRCAPVKFSPLTLDEMKGFAESRGLNGNAPDVESALKQAEGRPGLFDEKMAASALADQQDLALAMLSFKKHGFVSIFRVASDLLDLGSSAGSDAGAQFEASLHKISSWFRDALVAKMGATPDAGLMVFPALSRDVQEFSDGVSPGALVQCAETIDRYRAFARRQTDKNYVVECLLMEIGRIIRG